VREGKEREASDGFDGSWVAHPDLVPICQEVFDKYLGDRHNQLDVRRDGVQVAVAQLLDVSTSKEPKPKLGCGLTLTSTFGISRHGLAATARSVFTI
jgi:malate synthase